MAEQILCFNCGLTENKCECEKYCCFCMGQHDVRMVKDGLFYCRECRESCDYVPANS